MVLRRARHKLLYLVAMRYILALALAVTALGWFLAARPRVVASPETDAVPSVRADQPVPTSGGAPSARRRPALKPFVSELPGAIPSTPAADAWLASFPQGVAGRPMAEYVLALNRYLDVCLEGQIQDGMIDYWLDWDVEGGVMRGKRYRADPTGETTLTDEQAKLFEACASKYLAAHELANPDAQSDDFHWARRTVFPLESDEIYTRLASLR